MSPEKTKELLDKYPKLLERISHFEHGDGWFSLLDNLFDKLNHITNIQFVQIKEKFGSLRAYYTFKEYEDARDNENDLLADVIDIVISAAEEQSCTTCEDCGSTDNTTTGATRYWIRTLCQPCREQEYIRLGY